MNQPPADNLAGLRSGFGTGPLYAEKDGGQFEVDGVEFVCDYQPGSTKNRFFLVKNPDAVPGFLERAERHRNGVFVELGIAEGGSVALLALAGQPSRLVAIDIETAPRAALDELIEDRGLSERVHLHYGIDQADRTALARAVTSSVEGEALDCVIDDASHQLDLTRSSFDVLFPLLRPGGEYVIEDWSADHRFRQAVARQVRRDPAARERLRSALQAGTTPPHEERRPLSDLAVELMLARASHDQRAIDEVTVGPFEVVVRRGDGPLDPETFRLTDLVEDYFGYLAHPTPVPPALGDEAASAAR